MPGIAGPPTVPPQPPQDMIEDQLGNGSARRRRRRGSPVQPPLTAHQLRMTTGLVAGFLLGLIVSFANGLSVVQAAGRGIAFALVVGLIVWLLSWAVDTAVRKGYSPWLGVLAVIALNLVGIVVLLWLPSRTHDA